VRSDTDSDGSVSVRGVQKSKSYTAGSSSKEPHPFEIMKSKNAELIMSVKLKNREISKSRLELEKRLEETRKKLQSVRSNPFSDFS
jgi:hypothetical protein